MDNAGSYFSIGIRKRKGVRVTLACYSPLFLRPFLNIINIHRLTFMLLYKAERGTLVLSEMCLPYSH